MSLSHSLWLPPADYVNVTLGRNITVMVMRALGLNKAFELFSSFNRLLIIKTLQIPVRDGLIVLNCWRPNWTSLMVGDKKEGKRIHRSRFSYLVPLPFVFILCKETMQEARRNPCLRLMLQFYVRVEGYAEAFRMMWSSPVSRCCSSRVRQLSSQLVIEDLPDKGNQMQICRENEKLAMCSRLSPITFSADGWLRLPAGIRKNAPGKSCCQPKALPRRVFLSLLG